MKIKHHEIAAYGLFTCSSAMIVLSYKEDNSVILLLSIILVIFALARIFFWEEDPK